MLYIILRKVDGWQFGTRQTQRQSITEPSQMSRVQSQKKESYLSNSLWVCRNTWFGRNLDGIVIFFPANFLK